MKLLRYGLCMLIQLSGLSLWAATYYVSPNGSDANSGTSPLKAWASIAKVNASLFLPGDSLLFEGGKIFEGSLYFGAETNSTPFKPFVISSYGNGWATISSGTEDGLMVYNAAGFHISRLRFVGAGASEQPSSGINFFMDLEHTRLPFLHIESVEVSGYPKAGIIFSSWKGSSGYDDVSIQHVLLDGNSENGIVSYAEALLGHRRVYIAHCQTSGSPGNPNPQGSQKGIALEGVDNAFVTF